MNTPTLDRIKATGAPQKSSPGFVRLWAAGLFALVFVIQPTHGFAKAPPESFADLAERLLPAVVNISTTQTVKQSAHGDGGPEMPQFPPGSPFEDFFKDFFDRNQRPGQPNRPRRAQSLGSGFIIDKAGIVVTNNHVIAEADQIKVRLQDDTEFEAKLLGRDPKTDIAVLQIDPGDTELTAVEFGDSDGLRVGDWVVAIGNPFGLGGTVTAGIVSARGRDIGQGPYDDFIQTDASINKGNSGGPLFDLDGKVVGINTAIFSQSGGSVGIGFAVAARLAKPVVGQLQEFGRTKRGWLGVRIQGVSEEIAESLGLGEPIGALVASVTKDGPAEAAGVKAGDVILKFDGKSVETMRKLPRIVAETRIGIDVPVEVWRDGKKVTLTAKVGELEKAEQAQLLPASKTTGDLEAEKGKVEDLGLAISKITPSLSQQYSLDDKTKGVVITGVDAEGVAAEKGLREGDVVVEVGQQEVSSPSEVTSRVEEAKEQGRKSVLFLIDRQGEMRFVALRFNKG